MAASETGHRRPEDRERIVWMLTVWLRPEFVLRVLGRFQRLAGFDRAIGLAAAALTAVIPLTVLAGSIGSALGGKGTAQRLIDRYQLTGGGADAVREVFAPAGTSTTIGVVGVLFVLLAVMSFTRAVQRLFELSWDLKPLGVRNSALGLEWAALLVVYLGLSGLLHAVLPRGSGLELPATVLTVPLTAGFFLYTGWLLSGRRVPRRHLLPTAAVATGLMALYSVGASVYVPHLFNTYSTRYGVIGAVFAMISALFAVMVVIVVSVAAGREIHDELARIARGERPAPDEVHRQWAEITSLARSRWTMVRHGRRRGPGG